MVTPAQASPITSWPETASPKEATTHHERRKRNQASQISATSEQIFIALMGSLTYTFIETHIKLCSLVRRRLFCIVTRLSNPTPCSPSYNTEEVFWGSLGMFLWLNTSIKTPDRPDWDWHIEKYILCEHVVGPKLLLRPTLTWYYMIQATRYWKQRRRLSIASLPAMRTRGL